MNDENAEETNLTRANFNTILLFVLLGVLGFVGYTSVEVSKDVAAIKASQVSRSEIDTKIRDMEVKLESVRADYATLKVQLASIEVEVRKR
jgi:hypothetical protein